MHNFIIGANDYLSTNVQAFYHSNYFGGSRWETPGTIENIICTLKNDITPYTASVLRRAAQKLSDILTEDLPEILKISGVDSLTVCVVPRAKASYRQDQLLFKRTVCDVVGRLAGFHNGTDFIMRRIDTRTTHRNRSGHGGSGDMPYPEITKHTCSISSRMTGENVLLIDDLYTKTVNIDEDVLQAILDEGASQVFFYSVGRTVRR